MFHFVSSAIANPTGSSEPSMLLSVTCMCFTILSPRCLRRGETHSAASHSDGFLEVEDLPGHSEGCNVASLAR